MKKIVNGYLGMDGDEMMELREREVVAKETEAKAKAKLLTVQTAATVLRERQQLKEAGVSQEDIDKMLPLEKP